MALIRNSHVWILAATIWTSPAASYALSTISAHSSDDIFGLFARQTSCAGDSSLVTCGNGRPSNWCCPQTTQCLSLNNTGTQAVICCPNGSDCANIKPITCDTTYQDASKYPTSSVHALDLSLGLPLCGTQCCPLGYGCESGLNGLDPFCKLLDRTKLPDSTPSPIPTASSTTSTAISSLTGSPTPTSQPSKSKGSPAKIIVPVVLVVLALVLLALFVFLRRSRRKETRKPISDPIYNPELSARTDFVNRYRPRSSALRAPTRAEPTAVTNTPSPGRPATSDSRTPLNQDRDYFGTRTYRPPPQQVARPAGVQTQSPEMTQSFTNRPRESPSSVQYYNGRTVPAAPTGPEPRKAPPGSMPNPGTYTLPSTRYQRN